MKNVKASKNYIIKRYAPGTGLAIEQYSKLEDDIWNGIITSENIDCQSVINAIVDYVHDNETFKNNTYRKWIAKQIKDAPKLNNNRVYQFEPGTGKASTQFFKFAKAIVEGKITCENIKVGSLLSVIRNYVFDQIE